MGRLSANTGLLTARCDPYGAESRIQLLGGLYPESHNGPRHWHCSQPATARYRMECVGGAYGQRLSPSGIVPATDCAGGHRGQVMSLCAGHRREIARRQSGLCPACAYPPAARTLTTQLEALQPELFRLQAVGDMAGLARATLLFDDMRGQMDELITRGVVHKCPLRLVEVS